MQHLCSQFFLQRIQQRTEVPVKSELLMKQLIAHASYNGCEQHARVTANSCCDSEAAVGESLKVVTSSLQLLHTLYYTYLDSRQS